MIDSNTAISIGVAMLLIGGGVAYGTLNAKVSQILDNQKDATKWRAEVEVWRRQVDTTMHDFHEHGSPVLAARILRLEEAMVRITTKGTMP